MTPELKPCPFCGGPAELDTKRPFRSLDSGDLMEAVAVYCHECSAEISECYYLESEAEDLIDSVIEAWNKRVPTERQ